MAGAGFHGRWTELNGTYRMPPDLVPIVAEFARRHVPVEHRDLPTLEMDHPLLVDAYPETVRSWVNTTDLGVVQEASDAAERLLDKHPSLHPDDLVVLAGHSRGGQIMAELQLRGHEVSHIFTPSGPDQASAGRRRKRRFWGGTPGIKGCTVDSFKGWEARAVIAVPPVDDVTNRRAYIAMTRVKGDPGRTAFVTVVNTRLDLNSFKSQFERTVSPDEVPALGGSASARFLTTCTHERPAREDLSGSARRGAPRPSRGGCDRICALGGDPSAVPTSASRSSSRH